MHGCVWNAYVIIMWFENHVPFRVFDMFHGYFGMLNNYESSWLWSDRLCIGWKSAVPIRLWLCILYPSLLLQLHYREIDLRFNHHHICSVFDLAIWFDQ